MKYTVLMGLLTGAALTLVGCGGGGGGGGGTPPPGGGGPVAGLGHGATLDTFDPPGVLVANPSSVVGGGDPLMNDLIVGLDSDLDGIENNADDDIDGDGLLDANDNDDDGDGVLDVDEADNAAAVDPAHDGNDADGVDAVGGIMDASPLVMGVAGNPAAQNAGSKVTARAALLQTVEHIDRWPALKAVSEDTDWDGFPDAIGPAEPPDITDADVAAATAAGLVEDGDLDGDTFPNATDLRPRDPTRH